MWNTEAQTDIAASPGRVWQLRADVAGWPRWNAGVAAARLLGPFATGSRFEMQLPDGGPLLQNRRWRHLANPVFLASAFAWWCA